MLGTIVNCLAVLVGAGLGLLVKKGLPQRLHSTLNHALALCVVYIGISGMLQGQQTLVVIVALVLGGALGELLRLDDGMQALGNALQRKLAPGDGDGRFAQGFVSASLLFCVGAMAIVGSLQSGLQGDHATLYTKALLDMVSSFLMASTLGPGVLLSAVSVLLYQGSITLLASLLAHVLTDAVVAEMTCAGSLVIFALGLNMLGITKVKVANLLPALVLAPLLMLLL